MRSVLTTTRRMVFVLPRDRELPTGGNLYNRKLIAALRETGARIDITDEDIEPETQTEDYIFDSLCLDSIPVEHLRKSARGTSRILALLHYLPSLEPGLDEFQGKERREREISVLRNLDGLIVTSPFLQNYLSDMTDGPLTHIVRPALCIRPAPDESMGYQGNEMRAFMSANLLPGKGVLEFLRELAHGLRADDGLRVRIAGRADLDANYARACADLIQEQILLRERVTLLGPLSEKEMEREYRNHNVFISASTMETYGMAAAEARAFGLYVLARRAGYIGEHIPHDGAGRLFDTASALALSTLRLARDPDLSRKTREQAFAARVRDSYQWSDAAAAFLAAIAPKENPA